MVTRKVGSRPTSSEEWAQIELPAPAEVARIVISRDREGKYHDRVPVAFDVQLSLDGRDWETASRVQARPAIASRRQPQYVGPFTLPLVPTWDELLAFAFDCERYTWERISADDHLSPLKTDRPALPGGAPYWGRIARLDPLSRTLVQMDEMIQRLAMKGLDLAEEKGSNWPTYERRQTALQNAEQLDAAAGDSLYRDARIAKRRLMFRDPDLEGLRRVLFVKRHPYHASHNYSDILDSKFQPGGGVCDA